MVGSAEDIKEEEEAKMLSSRSLLYVIYIHVL